MASSDSETNNAELLTDPASEDQPISSSPEPSPDSTTSSPDSSPAVHSPSSSPKSDVPRERKRRRYAYDLEVPVYKEIYWPPTKGTAAAGEASTSSHPPESQSGSTESASSSVACNSVQQPVPPDEAVGSFCEDNSDSVLSDDIRSSSDEEESSSSDELESPSSPSSPSSMDSSGRGDQDEESTSNSEGSVTDFSDVDVVSDLKVYEGCNLSVDEGVVCLMDLFMTQKLSKSTLSCVLQLLHKFLPPDNNLPTTLHNLFKYVQEVSPPVPFQVHFYCESCLFYIGNQEKACHLCGGNCNKFYQLSLADQIQSLFENHNLAKIVDKYSNERAAKQGNGQQYFDICDASEYIRVQLPSGNYNLTLIGHTDGVSISNSSTVSLWPLEFAICEVPPQLRFKFVLIAGVWVDKSKPSMHCYLEPFASELKKLFNDGVSWINPETQSQEKSRVAAPFFCGDAPVRANLQSILEVAGKRSCNLCEQKTVKLPPEPVLPGVKKVKRKRVFLPREVPSTLRTAQRMETQGKACLEIQKNNRQDCCTKGCERLKHIVQVSYL